MAKIKSRTRAKKYVLNGTTEQILDGDGNAANKYNY